MTRDERASTVADALKATGATHHEAFLKTDGADPDWAIWYAHHLSTTLPAALGVALTRTQIVCLLAALELEHTARAMDVPWAAYYAGEMVNRLVPHEAERLTLYMMEGCPFCRRVQAVIDGLNIHLERIDVIADETGRRDLMAARGRATVPVLRCVSGVNERWMPESADIIRHLEEVYGTRA